MSLQVNCEMILTAHKTRSQLRTDFQAGDAQTVFLHGDRNKRQLVFEVLTGLTPPETGDVLLDGRSLYQLPEPDLRCLRRDQIGALPQSGGLLPELRLLDQVVLPLRLAGWSDHDIRGRLEQQETGMLPLYDLYNKPKRCSLRKQVLAALWRGLITQPRLIVINGLFDGFSDTDKAVFRAFLAALRTEDSILCYLSADPVPEDLSIDQMITL